MAPRAIIVTGADSRQFRLSDLMLRSLHRHGIFRRYPIGFLDSGLTDEERSRLPKRITVVPARWTFDFPTRAHYERIAPGLSMLSARIGMREAFPGYDVYVWIDADTILQDPTVIPDIVNAALRRSYVAAYEMDRAYAHNTPGGYAWHRYADWYEIVYPGEIARHMNLKPMINCGVFAMTADAPHWALWDWLYQRAMNRLKDPSAGTFMADQLSMNVAVYYHRLPMAVLPASCNWLCHLARPMWDAEAEKFCAPQPPYEPLRIVHFSGRSKSRPLRVEGRRGGLFEMRLRQPMTVVPVDDAPGDAADVGDVAEPAAAEPA